MTTQALANKWKELVEAVESEDKIIAELYHDDVIHVERGEGREWQGIEAKKEIAKQWQEHVMISVKISPSFKNLERQCKICVST